MPLLYLSSAREDFTRWQTSDCCLKTPQKHTILLYICVSKISNYINELTAIIIILLLIITRDS